MRRATRAADVLNRYLCQPRADIGREHRDEPVMFAEQPQLTYDVSAIRAERRADVVNRQSRQAPEQPVGGCGRPATVYAFLAIGPPAAHDVVAFFDLLEKSRDVFRKVLEVGVHRDDHRALGVFESHLQRRRLAIVAPERHERDARIDERQLLGHGQRLVAAAVIDQHELKGVPRLERARDVGKTPHELGQCTGLVEDGQYDADEWSSRRRHTANSTAWRVGQNLHLLLAEHLILA
jgi:hypothetical protein